jgi:Na+-transporting NADH:ubiquinone oxidoreductase subunit NqrF
MADVGGGGGGGGGSGGGGGGASDDADTNYVCADDGAKVSFGGGTYADEERARIQELLNSRLGREHLQKRKGPGGQDLVYVEGNVVLELANEVFGFNGWSCTILSITEGT